MSERRRRPAGAVGGASGGPVSGFGIGIPGRVSGVGVGRVRGRWGAVNTRRTSTNSVFLGWKASASKSPCDVPVMFLVVFGRSSPGSVRVRSGSEWPAFQVGVCVCFGEGLPGSALDPFPFDEIRLLFPQPSLPSSDCGLLSRRAFRLEWPFGFLRGGVCWPRGFFPFRFCPFCLSRIPFPGRGRFHKRSLPTSSPSFPSRRIPDHLGFFRGVVVCRCRSRPPPGQPLYRMLLCHSSLPILPIQAIPSRLVGCMVPSGELESSSRAVQSLSPCSLAVGPNFIPPTRFPVPEVVDDGGTQMRT